MVVFNTARISVALGNGGQHSTVHPYLLGATMQLSKLLRGIGHTFPFRSTLVTLYSSGLCLLLAQLAVMMDGISTILA
jgi:hypothetical protein